MASDKATASASASTPGFSGLLTLIFITLKLTGVIYWSWLWVLSPLWISAALLIFTLAVVIFVSVLCDL
jgi:hypothetical protein